jgi:hypothetical protein
MDFDDSVKKLLFFVRSLRPFDDSMTEARSELNRYGKVKENVWGGT